MNPKMLYLYHITPNEIKKYIDKLPAKNSSGYDNISNKLLKQIKYTILNPLIHIFNLSISSGVFPENRKTSEIVPLYKKGPKDQMINYRPISLLIKLSKLLEKCMYTCLYKFMVKNNIFIRDNMISIINTHVNKKFKIYMATSYKIKRMGLKLPQYI